MSQAEGAGGTPAFIERSPRGQAVDRLLTFLLDMDGAVEADGRYDADHMARQATNLGRVAYARAITTLTENELVTRERGGSRNRTEALVINETDLDEKILSGPYSAGVREALEEYRAWQSAHPQETTQPKEVTEVPPVESPPEPSQPQSSSKPEPPTELPPTGSDETREAAKTEVIELGLAADEISSDEETLPDGDAGLESAISMDEPEEPKPDKRKTNDKKPDSKTLNLSFEFGDRWFGKWLSGVTLSKFKEEVRVLIGAGKVNSPDFSFFPDPQSKKDYMLRLLNKGVPVDKHFSPSQLEALIVKEIESGHMTMNGKGPELTEDGMTWLLESTKDAKSKL